MKTFTICCMVFSALFMHAQSNLTTKLQACYNLDCITTGTLVANNAVTGAALNGTVHGNITCVTGHLGTPSTALQFGGTGQDYVALPNNPLIKPTTSITVSGWFYVTSSNYEDLVFTKSSCASIQPAYTLSWQNGKFGMGKYPSSCGSGTAAISYNNSSNAWHHIVAYADNTRLKIIVDNGTPVIQSHTIAFNYDPSTNVILGGSNDSYTFPFTGKMDNLRFYNRELTSAEVSTLYSLEPECTEEGIAPATDFKVSKTTACENEPVLFTDQSVNTPTVWAWQFEGGSPSTSTHNAPAVEYNTPGIYTVSLTATNKYGTGTTVSKTITVTTCAGMTSYEPQEQPEIFPNPAINNFTINNVSGCDVSISDISGRVIQVTHADSDSVEMNCSKLPAGVYCVTVYNRTTNISKVSKLMLYGSN